MKKRGRSFDCPHCGQAVAAGALACPGCGSDSRSGWSEEAELWSGGVPDGFEEGDELEAEAEYQDFLRREGLAEEGTAVPADVKGRLVSGVIVLLVLCVILWQVLR